MVGERFSNPTPLPQTPAGWSPTAIEDLCSKVSSGGTPLRTNQNFYKGGTHSWFKTGELKDSVLYVSEEKITDKALEESSAKLFPARTVLMAMYGDGKTITSLGLMGNAAATNQACCAMICDDSCDPRFLFYALKFHREDFIRLATGGAQRNLSGKLIRRFALNAPPISEQRAIARILGTLDDKIELNRRMNETLEAMARALFKSWFVDFDPARAKLEGREFDLQPSLAKLFPSSFDDSTLGEVPAGWRVQPISNLADIYSGGTPSKANANYWNGDLPWISPKVMTSIHVDRSDELVTSAAVGNGTRLVPKGAVLVMVRGMGLHQGVRICQARSDVTFNQDVKAFVPKWGDGTFLLFALLDASPFLFSKVQASGHGTGVLPTDILEGLSFVVPPPDVCEEILRPLAVLNAKIASNSRMSETLAALRDTLLPKLISGELRVKAAERMVEAVA